MGGLRSELAGMTSAPGWQRQPLTGSTALAASVAAVLLQGLGLLFFGEDEWTRAPQAILMSLVILATAFLGDEAGRFDVRQPWSVLLIFHLPFWVWGSFNAVLDESVQEPWITGARAFVSQSLFLIGLGFLLIALGYRAGIVIRLRAPRSLANLRPWSDARLLRVAIGAYALVWVTRLSWYSGGLDLPFTDLIARGGASSWARTFGTTVPLLLILSTWAAYYASETRRRLALACAIAMGELLWGVIYGVMKSVLFFPIFLPVIPYVIQKGRVPVTRAVVAGLALLLLIYPYVDAVRSIYFQIGGPSRTEAIREVWSSDVPLLSFGREELLRVAERASARASGLGSVAQILALDDQGALDLHGEFYRRAVLGLIPRALWPRKPIIHEGSYFTAFLAGYHDIGSLDLSTVYGSTAPTLFGSFFWNLGWPGLVASSLALGAFSGAAFRMLKDVGLGHPTVFLYYSAVLTVCDTTETEVAKFPSTLVWGLLLAWVAAYLVRSRATRPAAARHSGLAGHARTAPRPSR